MPQSKCYCTVLGHAGKVQEPVPGTKQPWKCSVAVNGPKSQDGTDPPPMWISLAWWSSQSTQFASGDYISASGTLTQRTYTTQDGQTRTALELRVDGWPIVIVRKNAESHQSSPATNVFSEDDALPF